MQDLAFSILLTAEEIHECSIFGGLSVKQNMSAFSLPPHSRLISLPLFSQKYLMHLVFCVRKAKAM